jgi:hypothetical protein
MVAEISGTPNGVKAHNASLLQAVRLIGIDVLEFYAIRVIRGVAGYRRPNPMLNARRIGGRICGI